MIRLITGLVVVLALAAESPPAYAQDAESDFHKAYYLEMAEGQTEQAAAVYQRVAESAGAPAALVEQARRRLALCQESVRSRELARLMPADALAYV